MRLIKSTENHAVVDSAIVESVASGTFDTKQSTNFASTNLGDILRNDESEQKHVQDHSLMASRYLHFICVHANKTRNFDFLGRISVVNRVALVQRPLIHSQIGQLTVTPFFKLECKTNKKAASLSGNR